MTQAVAYNDRVTDFFTTALGVTLTPVSNLSVIGALTTGGPAFDYNGRDSNVAFYDEKSSVVTLGLSASY